MTIDPISFSIGLIAGHIVAGLTVYLTAVCVRRLMRGGSIEPSLSRRPPSVADADGEYRNPYDRVEP